MKAALYKHFAASGELLYVGYSIKPINRSLSHSSSSTWFGEIATITIQWFDTSEEAHAAEIESIRRECPRENVSGLPSELYRKRVRRTAPKKAAPIMTPHAQLDALERAFGLRNGRWQYWRYGISVEQTNGIRETGRPLLTSEVMAIKSMLRTTYKRLAEIGIERGYEG